MPKRILVVDDDEDTQKLLKKRLKSHGFHCECASSVELAMKRLSHFKPDLVLLDLMFRGPNGTAFLRHARERFWPDKKGPPVLVLSGCYEKEVVDFVLDIGAVGFIRKPIDSKHLMSMINEYII